MFYECVETIESEIGTIQRFALGLVGLLSLKSEHDTKCYQCCRSYASSQSLWNHKQNQETDEWRPEMVKAEIRLWKTNSTWGRWFWR